VTHTPPTAAEVALAAEVSRCRFTAPHQLERWRAKRWLPPTDQWTDPATSALRPDIVHRAAWLAALSRPGRGISWIGWTFWAIDDTEQTAALLRQALIRTSNCPCARQASPWPRSRRATATPPSKPARTSPSHALPCRRRHLTGGMHRPTTDT
jgi:hypothetical protein